MTTILVANRGEVALRVFRTARRMGMRCVAIYSDADPDAPFVRAADEAIRIGPPPPAESYLRADLIVEAALRAGAELVHPGYGFLAEDAAFAEACSKAGLRFVGPPPDVLRSMGAKDEARRIATGAGVPVLSGYAGEQSDEAFARAAGEIGYPVIVKPAEGGGGKGMSVVRTPAELAPALASARRLGAAAFGDDRLLLERFLEEPRHVEVQVIADEHGNVFHLGERDCSLQRRHQKVLEETPSPAVDDALRSALCDAAVRLARVAGYVNAGTCEFLVDGDGTFGFIEMNARLQVEHPVTEVVWGQDLVELQLRAALGERLGLEGARPRGHAVEVRLYAEDPDEGFLPQAGRVVHVRWPSGARVDSGIEEGSLVSAHYDPMLAKVIVHAADRAAALHAMEEALKETEILGVRTNLALVTALAADSVVREGRVTTSWLERAYRRFRSEGTLAHPVPLVVAAAAEAERLGARAPRADPWAALGGWRAGTDVPEATIVLQTVGSEEAMTVRGRGPFVVEGIEVERAVGCHAWTAGGRAAAAAPGDGCWYVGYRGSQWEVVVGPRVRRAAEGGPAHLGAPMPGQVIAVRVGPGERVSRGQELVVVEAMKMEHSVVAPADGVVKAVMCAAGDQVERGQTLVDFEGA